MKVIEEKELIKDKNKYFNLGFLKAFDMFGVLNKYNIENLKEMETYSYKEGFIRTGNSLRKYINE